MRNEGHIKIHSVFLSFLLLMPNNTSPFKLMEVCNAFVKCIIKTVIIIKVPHLKCHTFILMHMSVSRCTFITQFLYYKKQNMKYGKTIVIKEKVMVIKAHIIAL